MADLTQIARDVVEALKASDWERTKALMTPDYLFFDMLTLLTQVGAIPGQSAESAGA